MAIAPTQNCPPEVHSNETVCAPGENVPLEHVFADATGGVTAIEAGIAATAATIRVMPTIG